jgi:hypothetical protein
MTMTMNRLIFAAAAIALSALTTPATSQETSSIAPSEQTASTFNSDEILAKGHEFFGKTSRNFAKAVEFAFRKQGEPTAYIVGEESSAAFFGGLRYGEGTVYYKDGTTQKIFWQGPSIGWDFGGNGSRTLTLVYNSQSPDDLMERFAGIEGAAYLVGGLGVNFQKSGDVILAPIRTGVGARLGANVGYVKYSSNPTWNPF